jgi:hypothetical protein
MTFDDGLINTCLFPPFSAFTMLLRQSANVFIRTIFTTIKMRVSSNFKQELQTFISSLLPPSFSEDHFLSNLVLDSLNQAPDIESLREPLSHELPAFLGQDTDKFLNQLLEFCSAKLGKAHSEGKKPTTKAKEAANKAFKVPMKSVIYLKKVPRDLNNKHTLIEFFRSFGTVVNVQLFQRKNIALIKFSKDAEAQAVMDSSEAILGDDQIIKSIYYKKATVIFIQKRPIDLRVAKEVKMRKKELLTERTSKIKKLLQLFNEKKDQLSTEQQEALLKRIRELGHTS